MVWQKNHDNADLDERLHRLREDPFDLQPRMVQVSEDYLIALEAKVLRQSALLYSSRELTNGFVEPAVLPMIASNGQVAHSSVGRALDRLVKVGLLTRRNKRAGGGWDIRNFLKYNPTKEQVLIRRESVRRLAWLQDTPAGRKVRDFIKRRDGMRCRYCYIEMSASDHRSPIAMQYDHARPNDPDLARDPRWIVQACAFHNGMKQDRTPEEAGLELLPPYSEADTALRTKAQQLQDIAMTVAARLADADPTPDEIREEVERVLQTWSETKCATENQKATQRPPDGHPFSSPGRVGSGRSGLVPGSRETGTLQDTHEGDDQ